MNVSNNKKRQNSIKKIKESFMILLDKKDLKDIKVNEICELAHLNRTTFYANFKDIYDLVGSIKDDFENEIITKIKSFGHEEYFLDLFKDIYENQIAYKAYLKLFSDKQLQSNLIAELIKEKTNINREIEYRIAFFRAGLAAILKKRLNEGCKETPEEIHNYLLNEYGLRLENEPKEHLFK